MTLFRDSFTQRDSLQPRLSPQVDFTELNLIEQIEDDPQTVSFVGNMMPMVPLSYGGGVNIISTYYAGQKDPTVQITHATEKPVQIKGRLKDKRQPANTSPVAYVVAQAIEELRKRGNLLKIELGEWVRYGYLENTIFDLKTLRDIDFVLEFFIVGVEPPIQCPIKEIRRSLPRDANKRLKDIDALLQNNILTYPENFPKGPLDTLSDIISDLATPLANLTASLDSSLNAADQGSTLVNRALSLALVAKTAAFRANQRLGKIFIETQIRLASAPESLDYSQTSNAYPAVKRQSVTSGYRNVAYIQNIARNIERAKLESVLIERDLRRILEQIPKARHLVRSGETLQTIAVKYYGDAEQWPRIYSHNSLETTLLSPAQILEIPN